MKKNVFLLIPACLGLALAFMVVSASRAAELNMQPDAAQPHPILSDIRVRQAIAYCTDKVGLVAAAFPDMPPAQREALIVDSFIPPTSWAYTPAVTTYPYSPTLGGALLHDAGWVWPPGENYRMKDGRELVVSIKTTNAQLRQDVVAALTTQLAVCGIRLEGFNLPPTYFFSNASLYVRDFSIAEFAWLINADEPGGYELFSCTAIPKPDNGWSGQNYMGWCNQAAETALITATNTSLPTDTRKAAYALMTEYIAQDVPTIPLFLREAGTGTYEHFDFNLETFSSRVMIITDTLTVLPYQDFFGHSGFIEIPPGAVVTPTEVNDLMYSPLNGTFFGAPAGMREVVPFRLTMFTRGVPQEFYSFNQPITVTVPYSLTDLSRVYENTLSLFYSDGDAFARAVDSCPPESQYEQLNTVNQVYTVHVCHLSEFTLAGEEKFLSFMPMLVK